MQITHILAQLGAISLDNVIAVLAMVGTCVVLSHWCSKLIGLLTIAVIALCAFNLRKNIFSSDDNGNMCPIMENAQTAKEMHNKAKRYSSESGQEAPTPHHTEEEVPFSEQTTISGHISKTGPEGHVKWVYSNGRKIKYIYKNGKWEPEKLRPIERDAKKFSGQIWKSE